LTAWPLSGAVNTGLLLNIDGGGGAREKASRNLEKILFLIIILSP
jgi:hypothetical protein